MMKGRRFSFSRMMMNAFPAFISGTPSSADIDISPQHADLLYIWQMGQQHPTYLTPESFLQAGVIGSKAQCKPVYNSLVKGGIISPAPGSERKGSTSSLLSRRGSASSQTNTSEATMERGVPEPVMTKKIDRTFVHLMSHLSVFAQKKLVAMLFFWEEECMRLKLLDEEEREILQALQGMDGAGEPRNEDLAIALERVDVKRKMLPTARGYGGSAGQVPVPRDELPSYA